MAVILVVDDDQQYCDLLKAHLESAHDVYLAYDANHAIEIYSSKKPEIVISDILMPDKDGIELLLNIKNDIGKSLRGVIMISGGGKICASDYLTLADILGADEVLEKPINLDFLSSKIASLV